MKNLKEKEGFEIIIRKYLKESENFGLTIVDSKKNGFLNLEEVSSKSTQNNYIEVTGIEESEEGADEYFSHKTTIHIELENIKKVEEDACSLTILYKDGQEIELENWI